MKTIERDGVKYYVSQDGKEYKSRSGAWKRDQKLANNNHEVEGVSIPTHTEEIPPSTPSASPADDIEINETETEAEAEAEKAGPKWMDFQLNTDQDATDTIPAPLKMITAQEFTTSRKRTAKELRAMRETEVAMLKAGLSGLDIALSAYGKGVTLNPDFTVKHSDQSKTIVANAQASWLEEKGILLTEYLSKGVVAGTLTVWYCAGPLMRIKREAKKPMLKKLGSGFLSRLPLIGRWFRKKEKDQTFQVTVGDEKID